MEGVRVFTNNDIALSLRDSVKEKTGKLLTTVEALKEAESLTIGDKKQLVERDLRGILTGLARHLFGADTPIQWRYDYFPFTEPSLELEVKFQDRWMEVLGCGVIHDEVLKASERRRMSGARPEYTSASNALDVGWAFGLGLERLAMVLFSIPDIRLFWSEDPRFAQQFKSGQVTKFEPFSKFPLCYKDVSFWVPSAKEATDAGRREFHINDVFEVGYGIDRRSCCECCFISIMIIDMIMMSMMTMNMMMT